MMTILTHTLLYALSLMPQSPVVGNPVGTWRFEAASQTGEMIASQLVMSDKGTYTVDLGADGVIEFTGKYTLEGDLMMVQDAPGSECTALGTFEVAFSGETMVMTRVTDDCQRGGPDGKLVFTRN